MIKKTLLVVASLAVVLVAFASVMYVRNPPPTVPVISSAEAANPSKPYVVKLHAQWCPICMLTKTVWSQIEVAYSGRANSWSRSVCASVGAVSEQRVTPLELFF